MTGFCHDQCRCPHCRGKLDRLSLAIAMLVVIGLSILAGTLR